VQVSTILDQIELDSMALPEFQRGYVWNRDQVRGLMQSLYRRYPVGSLLVWVTKTEAADPRGEVSLPPGNVRLLVDGQQRITSLYGIIRGEPPKFFEGNREAFTGLHFNLEEEAFEFYAPLKMRDNPLWIDVTKLMTDGLGAAMQRVLALPDLDGKSTEYLNRLNAVHGIREVNFHIEEVVGEDKTVDVVVDIFNRVNSGGTKLTKGDLALAKICAEWPDARREMNQRLHKWRRAGFNFRLEWLLRNVNTIVTGEALFSAFKDVEPAQFREGLAKAEKSIDFFLELIASRLGLDHDRVLSSRFAFPLLSRYFWQRDGQLRDPKERDLLLYWYVHTILWGRYAGSTETILNQDLEQIENLDGGLERLLQQLRQNRPDLQLRPDDFSGWNRGSRFYPLLYLLTRVHGAMDWETGIQLSAHMLGKSSSLHLHHIFPKSLLYEAGYSRPEVNAIANFTFLTADTNLRVSNRDPLTYLASYAEEDENLVRSHWIPLDPELWRVEAYTDFLAARRELLAGAANEFLNGLAKGAIAETPETISILDVERPEPPGGPGSEEEEELVEEINTWIVGLGLPEGETLFELTNDITGEPVAVLDLAWPNGLQEGLSEPVTLLIDEDTELEEIVNQAGYRFFTDPATFKQYVRSEILAVDEAA
jgi:hypothetical protein